MKEWSRFVFSKFLMFFSFKLLYNFTCTYRCISNFVPCQRWGWPWWANAKSFHVCKILDFSWAQCTFSIVSIRVITFFVCSNIILWSYWCQLYNHTWKLFLEAINHFCIINMYQSVEIVSLYNMVHIII